MSNLSGPKSLNADRRTLIWKWIVDPDSQIPSGLTEEEMLAVFGNSVVLLHEFRKTLGRVGQMYQALAAQEWKKVGG